MIELDWSPYKENTSVIGANQEGKSEFVKKLVKILVASGFNVIVFAVHENLTEIDPTCVKRTLFDIKGKGLEILFPYEITRGYFEMFCKYVYRFKNVVVVIDELHNFVKKQATKGNNNLELLFKNCNNRSIGYIAIFQAPSEVPSFVLRLSNHHFVFYLDLPTDIEYVSKWISPLCKGFVTGEIQKYQCIYKTRHQQGELMTP
jgi:hypothetical protein